MAEKKGKKKQSATYRKEADTDFHKGAGNAFTGGNAAYQPRDANSAKTAQTGGRKKQTEFDDDNHHYTKIDYEVITDNYEWFTLKINVLETMASSSNFAKYYHINKKNNQLTKLSDLFKNGDYKEVFVQEIKHQMLERMSDDPTLTYWIDDYDDGSFKTIENDQNFYFNKKGELVIVFNEYEVGPGSIGSQEFIIAKSIYEDYLK